MNLSGGAGLWTWACVDMVNRVRVVEVGLRGKAKSTSSEFFGH